MSRRSPKWSIALTALVGAWVGHFIEYVRVAGWHAGLSDMGSSVHSYFFPAGAALTALLVGMGFLARRAWTSLGERLRAAEVGLWKRPSALPTALPERPAKHVGLFRSWVALVALQLGTWLIQENLETMAAGRPAPLFTVMTGIHWLAPVVQAEVALILAVVYWLGTRWFADRRSRVVVAERFLACRWSARYGLLPVPGCASTIPSAPLDRWGAQRWNRPPPFRLLSA